MIPSPKMEGGQSFLLEASYQIEELVERGATSKVYRGRHLLTGSTVGIKRVEGQKSSGEVQVWRSLVHPSVIRLFQVIQESNDSISFIMEWARGGELFGLLQRSYPSGMPASMVWHIFGQLVQALTYLHGPARTAHRDLKLENILIVEEQPIDRITVKLGDFGYAVQWDDENGQLDLVADHCGSTAYAAPEVLRAFAPYNARAADIYALGVIIYALSTGHLPFSSASDDATIGDVDARIRSRSMASKWNPDRIQHGKIRECVARMLNPLPTSRPTAQQLLQLFHLPPDNNPPLDDTNLIGLLEQAGFPMDRLKSDIATANVASPLYALYQLLGQSQKPENKNRSHHKRKTSLNQRIVEQFKAILCHNPADALKLPETDGYARIESQNSSPSPSSTTSSFPEEETSTFSFPWWKQQQQQSKEQGDTSETKNFQYSSIASKD